jgi:NAD(P)H-dependent flavin oxidoreductase YrpB (nitropropane dioxygenase family)
LGPWTSVELVAAVSNAGGLGSLGTALRSSEEIKEQIARTPFVEKWNQHPDNVKMEAERLRSEMMDAMLQGRGHELLPFTGQTAGMIRETLPAVEIVRSIAAGAEEALNRGTRLLS